MDVENMHPFCLPFSLCHDAPSSGMASIIDTATTNNCNGNNISNMDTNMTNLSSNIKDLNRSETSSPSDEIFTHLNTNSLTSQSILNDDSIIESADIMADDSILFYSIHSDTDVGTDITKETESTDDIGFHEEEDLSDICKNNDDDWYSANYSLFSPSSIHHQPSRERKSTARLTHHLLGHNHHHHQVFQHVVDPLDIKSSPTLAQLNLNASDDPNESIWDASSTTTAIKLASISTSVTSASSTDLLTNCTSIYSGVNNNNNSNINNNHHSCAHSNLNSCNHHVSPTNNHHQHTMAPYAANLGSNQLLSPCHHFHHHHHHHNDQANNRVADPHDLQGTCLAVAPFFRRHSHSSCCQNHLFAQQGSHVINNGSRYSGCSSSKQLMADFETQPNRQEFTTISGGQLQSYQSHHHETISKQNGQRRCASPALVTSSSSPLSAMPTSSNPGDNRIHDNKLKENIDYLTALLCNEGNKMENVSLGSVNQQHNLQNSTISSTMIKSYATLAQTLSTGPRLLERQQTISGIVDQNQHSIVNTHSKGNNLSSQQQQQHSCNQTLPNSEAHSQSQQMSNSSGLYGNPPSQMINQMGNPSIIRSYSDQWFKPTVESSVSAADSTAENQPSIHGSISKGSTCNLFISHSIDETKARESQQTTKISDLRVLSSNDCSSANCSHLGSAVTNHHQVDGCTLNQPMVFSEITQQMLSSPQHQLQTMTNQPGEISHQLPNAQSINQDSIPPNGRLITLTPIATSGIIVQQRPMPQRSSNKLKAPLFAQPASPSASSTASSGGNMDSSNASTTSSSMSSTTSTTKRQKTDLNQKANTRDGSSSSRSARPNSLSNDCSLSSHDEGFSSQVDNDDGQSNRDSDEDEDDEVDSDDESFYGDYTNNDLIGASISDNADCKWTLNMGRTRRNGQKRFFWQYNVQSKGPKGARICSSEGTNDDPFVLPEASDPVFSNDCQIEGVKHSGKARRGDGNDLTPNPKKLLMIGLELKKLGKIINDLVPVTDLPVNARNTTRKEKNKLASRACRLKKKAQHEANKIKLYGLQLEHQQVVVAIYDVRKFLRERLQAKLNNNVSQPFVESPKSDANTQVEAIVKKCLTKVAGSTSDYVNSVLEKVVSGCIDGGLQT